MARISVEILGRHLGTALASDEITVEPFNVYTFEPAPGVNLPALCDLVIDLEHGWLIPTRNDGAGAAVYPDEGGTDLGSIIDLVDLLHTVLRPQLSNPVPPACKTR